MKIFLIRHGETTGDIEGRFGVDYDDHLTDNGRQQAADLAVDLEGKGIEVVLSSPRIRAVQTSEVLTSKLDITMEVIEVLRERNNYGVMTGMTKDEAKVEHPEEYAKIEKDKTYHDVKESESYESITRRSLEALEIIRARDEVVIAVVTHGGIISTVVREVLGYSGVKIEDCGYMVLESEGTDLKVESLHGIELIK